MNDQQHYYFSSEGIEKSVSIPLILMGYFNPVATIGVEISAANVREIGIDGLIFTRFPLDVYQETYEAIFKNMPCECFLDYSANSNDRIHQIDCCSDVSFNM